MGKRLNAFSGLAPLCVVLLFHGCDDVAVQSFGGNDGKGGGSGQDAGLGRGHAGNLGTVDAAPSAGGTQGSGTIAISVGGSTGLNAVGGSAGTGGAGGPGGRSSPGGATGGLARGTGGAPGTGGNSATPSGGGMAGAGASMAGSGGSLGAGGVQATGNAPATGGATSTGGVTSTGGRSGAGGGTPVVSTGGSGGDENTAGDDSKCAQYIVDYSTALVTAKTCDDKPAACSKTVAAALSGCNTACTTYVDDDSMLKDIRKKWDKAGCTPAACTISICIVPASAACMTGATIKSQEGKKGVCTDSLF